MDAKLALLEAGKLVFLAAFMWFCGHAVLAGRIRVNYTRKMIHFFLFAWQFILLNVIAQKVPSVTALRVIDGPLALFMMTALLVRPLRSRSATLATMFASYDRPEDRPHSLIWFAMQLGLTYVVAAPLNLYFQSLGAQDLMTILILVNGLGDGLAEPVGVRFGKHQYETRALMSTRRYHRSLEGSACVFISAVGSVLLFHAHFTMEQWLIALMVLPIIMTLAEAWSPHTMDSPILYLVGGATLAGILYLP